jgi:tetratricopeptide (TPR) repeat protein
VTAARPDDGGILRPASTRIDERAGSKFVLPPSRLGEVPVREDVVVPYTSIKLRPLSMSPAELEQVILEEVEAFSESKKLVSERHRPSIEPLLQDLRMASEKAVEPNRSLLVEDKLLRLPTRTESGEEKRKKLETGVPGQVVGEGVSQSREDVFGVPDVQVDVYEQMKRQISSVRRFLEQPAGVEQAKEEVKKVKTTDEAKRRDEELFAATKARRETRRIAAEEEGKRELTSSKELPLQPSPEGEAAERGHILEEQFGPEITAEGLSGKGPVDKEVDTELKGDVAAKAREILGEHKTFASFAEDKFNRHMRVAEEYLKRGRFYRAADAYTLASIYKPDDPLAYAGKSHALFAAGEYMSSALFLSRALEIFPEYAQFKIDLVAMVGDKDKLESRIANVEQWLDESGAAELQFLLGYVYYQMGRHPEAQEMINAAFEKMPESPAVVALKKAIADPATARPSSAETSAAE